MACNYVKDENFDINENYEHYMKSCWVEHLFQVITNH